MALCKTFKPFLVFIVLALVLSEQVDARRTILKGRKTLTRRYYSSSAMPSWAVVLLVALGEILAGAVMYLAMKKLIIDTPIVGSYTPAAHHDEP